MIVSTGFFDGVHLGHRAVIERLVSAAAERGDESMVVTFSPHPRNVLQDEARNLRLLMSPDEKREMLHSLGVDHVEVVRFTKEFSRLSAEEYLKEYVVGRFGGKCILVGYDNRMGSDKLTPDELRATAEKLGIEVIVLGPAAKDNGAAVSSTRIREALSAGDAEAAASMLGYRYSLLGVTVAGNRLGRTIGFPTANIRLYDPLKLVPGNGVYAVEVETVGGHFSGMCNIGVRPTVASGNSVSIETNIFDFDEDIYGLDIRLSFVRKIREEMTFPSLEGLRLQLERDREICRAILDAV